MTEPRLTLERSRTMTLPQLLRFHARTTPGGVALRFKHLGIWREITWAQYYDTARQFAAALLRAGIGRGDRIAIASEGTPEWFFADLGAEIVGVEVVGIYPTNPWNELQYIVRHSAAKAIVGGDQEQVDKVIEARAREGGLPDLKLVLAVDPRGMRQYEEPGLEWFENFVETGRQALEADPALAARLDHDIDTTSVDDVCILVYTSGTTGAPKGAMLSHRNLTAATAAFAEASGMDRTPYSAVCYLPLCHVGERTYSMVQHLLLGGTVNFAEAVETVATNIREIAPSFFLGVPRIWEKLREDLLFRSGERQNIWRRPFALALRRGRTLAERRAADRSRPLDALEQRFWHWTFFRNVQAHMGLDRSAVRVCGGGAVSGETLAFFDMIGLPICQAYGLTESSGMAFSQRPGKWRIGTCGTALPGTDWKLADDGEILLRSDAVFHGYLHDPAATQSTMTPEGFLKTGDIGTVDAAGELTIVDRKKAIIITAGGKNIAPSEIENALRDSPYIREAIVVGEARKFVGALIQIDFDTVGRWASEQDIAYSGYGSLARNPQVRALIQSVVDKVNTRFARVENVRRFAILEKELDHDDGELTATQKIRRTIIETKFAREMQEIYGVADAILH
ncbi:AMP-dependent synthetase/ligase [Gemmobacter sp.]|uniref:AMP-dependent synthetase/ligase n=1 Tax=Gemmobacter sp. TaxID=1898957 RepID=UPI002AFFD551|nr:AMP-binding protein [Gemmobacter sp.]